MTITISQAGSEALDSLEQLWRVLYRHHAAVAPQLAQFEVGEDASWVNRRAYYAELLADEEGKAFFTLAHSGSDLVGYAMTSIVGGKAVSWDLGDAVAEMHTLSIDPAHRRQGIGHKVLAGVRDTLASLNVDALQVGVITTNAEAQTFYERVGLLPFVSSVLAPLSSLRV